jgi:hypothetical protein
MVVITLLAAAQTSLARANTEVPPVVPGAKPIIVEHIKIPGEALRGNLEGNAVDRDAVVFLPSEAQITESGPWLQRK